uniref:hypothetical protein n=1 Tax=Promicromonospora sp. CA-291202 TaxID=3240016 RepID=UPI003F494ABA
MLVVRPHYATRLPRVIDIATAERGARMFGLPLKDQGIRVARLLEARHPRRPDEALRQELVIQMPRRATKTTSIFATLLGRCDTRRGHRVVVTAQSGNIASQIMREHAQILLARGYAVESRARRRRPGRIVYYANGGRERLEWPSTDRDGNIIDVSQEDYDDVSPEELEELGIRLGSKMWAVPPDPGAVRSQASDDIWIDEAGELEGDVGNDLLTGVLPLMDTRGELAQIIVSGTPGKFRAGLFWDLLSEAREGGPMAPGILDYSATDEEAGDPQKLTDRKVWRRVHPGLSSGLVTVKTLEKRLYRLGPVRFAREYMCMWPVDGSVSAIDKARWKAARVPQEPLPARFGLAYDVANDGSTAAVAAAWRDPAGIARVAILDYRSGVSWVPAVVHGVARKYRVPIRYDGIGANHGPAGEIGRRRGAVTLVPGYLKDAAAAAQLIVSDLGDRTLVHFDQSSLNAAAEGAAWRQTEGGRLFARRVATTDTAPLVAASLALYQFDQMPARSAGALTFA